MVLLDITEPGETPEKLAPAIGIDLGTTHSVVALSLGQSIAVFTDEAGNALIPSIVAYEGERAIVGSVAREKMRMGDKDTISSIKRLMDPETNGAAMPRLSLGGKERTPVEISADILREMKRLAEIKLKEEITRAVITVPAYFSDSARAATKDAARLAGLDVLRLLNEPTAAALAYGLDKKASGVFAVYDLGGGTFDISILSLEDGVFRVLATAGDTHLGGDDFDAALADFLTREMSLKGGDRASLLLAVRGLKETLSDAAQVTFQWEMKSHCLTREAYETMIGSYIQRTLFICENTLSDSNLAKSAIEQVILVGGATRTPAVRAAVEEFFGRAPLCELNPDEVVAIGAALQAEALTKGADHLLLDVLPLSLGLETMGGLYEKLINRNTPIPVSVSQEFTTYQDGQQGLIINVLQGEREMAVQNRSLAQFELKGIPPMVAGAARIAVNFSVDADGMLTVSARETLTGIAQNIHVTPSYGLSFEEMKRMLQESMNHARSDIFERVLTEAIVEARRLILEVCSAIMADRELLKPGEESVIDSQVRRLESAIEKKDRDAVDYEKHELANLTQGFAERRMDKAAAAALGGKRLSEFG